MKKAFLIAGMHRSGTSMVARLMNLQGIALPHDLLGADQNNQAGYWESCSVGIHNDALLRLGESSWFDHRAHNVPDHAKSALEGLRQQIQTTAMGMADLANPAICIKDPRICRLLPYWLEAFEAAECNVTVIIPFRNPLEVAASIMKRDGLGAEQCLKLWLRHVLDAERYSRELPRTFFAYETVLTDWPTVLRDMGEKDLLNGIDQPADAAEQAEAFTNPTLKHWSFSASDLDIYCGKNALVSQAFRLMQRACHDDGVQEQEIPGGTYYNVELTDQV
jgi:hypothetical protein